MAVRASTTTRVRTRILADGTQSEESVEVPGDIGALATRLRSIVRRDGRDLLLANLLLQSRGLAAEAKAQVQTELDAQAKQIVDRSMWQAGAAAALSPLPVLDLAAGLGITSHMVLQLARVYRQSIDLETAGKLIGELGKQLVSVAGANVAAPLAAGGLASLLKTVPGVGTITGGLLQGLVQVLVTRWIGGVFIQYFRNELHQRRPTGPVWPAVSGARSLSPKSWPNWSSWASRSWEASNHDRRKLVSIGGRRGASRSGCLARTGLSRRAGQRAARDRAVRRLQRGGKTRRSPRNWPTWRTVSEARKRSGRDRPVRRNRHRQKSR